MRAAARKKTACGINDRPGASASNHGHLRHLPRYNPQIYPQAEGLALAPTPHYLVSPVRQTPICWVSGQNGPSTDVLKKSMPPSPFCQGPRQTETPWPRTSLSFVPYATPDAAPITATTTSSGHTQQEAPVNARDEAFRHRTVPTSAETSLDRSFTAYLQHPAASLVQAQALSIG